LEPDLFTGKILQALEGRALADDDDLSVLKIWLGEGDNLGALLGNCKTVPNTVDLPGV
jgi:hypothetical protein